MDSIAQFSLGALALLLAGTAAARPMFVPDDPKAYANATLIGDRIEAASGVVQIVYLHGMRASGPDGSADFRAELEREFNLPAQRSKSRCFIDLGDALEHATYHGVHIWRDEQQRLASRPFIDTYQYALGGKTVQVAELNWWPLLHPLKCQFLVVPEAQLAGAARNHVELCAGGDVTGRSSKIDCDPTAPIHYPWVRKSEASDLLTRPPPGGRGAWPNAAVKRQILDWGLADAVIALGTLRPVIARAVDQAFARMPDTKGPRIAITESLGSFVLVDAAERGKAAAQFLADGPDFYFFANQFALLELARLQGIPAIVQAEKPFAPGPEEIGSPLDRLLGRQGENFVPRPGQIIAFHDPSDALTFLVPRRQPNQNPVVVNIFVKQSGGPFRLFANPAKAHRGAITDRTIWRRLLRRGAR